jgi:acyl carrier protein
MAEDPQTLKHRIKTVMIDELMLQETPEEIGDDLPLFGPDGLGLDSVDALQLVVALEKNFGLKIPDAEVAKGVLTNVMTVAEAIQKAEGTPA